VSATRLSPLDAAWLFTESRATPNHVGGLLQFKLPPDAPRDCMRALMADFRSHRNFTAPWNRRLKLAFNENPVPAWIEDDDIDLEYHVRHAALPWPGGERELGELVGRLQSTPLDLSRPPWECTIIEGLDGGRFALFIKMHHSLIDGVSGMKLLQRAMAGRRGEEPRRCRRSGPRASRRPARTRGPPGRCRRWPTPPPVAVQGLSAQARSVPQLVAAFGKMLRRIGDPGDGMMPCPSTRRSRCSTAACARSAASPRSSSRWRACAPWPTAAHCTLNDVVLALCGGALRRFLRNATACPTSR
jgi:diacylglycerol O-acyltransferase